MISAAVATTPNPSPHENVRQMPHLLALQNEWAEARVKRNVAFLEKLYAEEFRITAMNGTIVERDADIANFASGALQPQSITDDSMKVSIYGEVAVVTGRE